MKSTRSRNGLFLSYNESKNGPIDDAVHLSNTSGYVDWRQRTTVDSTRLSLPTTILIKISGKDRFYQGTLTRIKRAADIDIRILSDPKHRPANWIKADATEQSDFKCMLSIAGLKEVPRPAGVAKNWAPQNIWLVEEAVLIGDELDLVRAEKEQEGAFNPSGEPDARKRIHAAIVVRQGQGVFRRRLLYAYNRRCAVTSCDAEPTLEAAHIVPYSGPATNNIENGLLLRADVHTLFDLNLIAVDPSDYRVHLSKLLKNSQYRQLAGKLIRLPANSANYPSCKALEWHYAKFRAHA